MKRLWLLIFGLMVSAPAFPQLAHNDWRIGISGGFSTYYGDLSPYPVNNLGDFGHLFKLFRYNKHYTDKLSWQLSLEKRWTATTGVMLHYGQQQFSMSDRYILPDGSLKTTAPNFDRALNFQTDLRDIGLSLLFKTDNGRFLSENAFFAPYISLGAGYLWFDVNGDLLDDEGNPYDNSSNAIIHNRHYETALPPLRTEREGGYPLHGWYGQVGLGFRLKISHRLEFFVQSDFRHAFTDYLDDVSGQYRENYDSEFQEYAAYPGSNEVNPESPWRGNSNGKNDWYIYHGAGLKFSFGATNKGFVAPKVSSRYNYSPEEAQEAPTPIDAPLKDSLAIEKPSPITQNYYTYLHWENGEKWEQLEDKISNLELEIEILERQRLLDSISNKMDSTRLGIRAYDLSLQKTEKDTLLSPEEKTTSIDQLQTLRQHSQSRLDSLGQQSTGIQSQIDSLRNLKKTIAPLKTREGVDSLAFINELRNVPQQIQSALVKKQDAAAPHSSSQNQALLYSNDIEDTSEQVTSPKTDKIESHYMEWMRGFQKDRQVDQARTDSLLQAILEREKNIPNQIPQEETTSPEVPLQAQKESSRRPILIFGGNRRTEKSQQPPVSAQETPATSVPPTPQEGVKGSNIINEEVLPIALALGMQRLGLNLSAVDTKTESNDEVNSPLTRESTTAPLPTTSLDTITKTDTLYLEKSGEIKLISAKTEVYFENNQTQPSDEEIAKLKPLVEYVQATPGYGLHLTGYADNTGSLSYNLRIIEKRMERIRQILMEELKVEADKISTSMGGQIRRSPQSSAEEKDRKVEVKIVSSTDQALP